MFGLITKRKMQEKIREFEIRSAGEKAKEVLKLLNELHETKDELEQLKRQLEAAPKRLSDINLTAKRREMADNAWYGKPHYLLYTDVNGNPVLSLYGHTYEPGYESFSSTCTVSGFDSTGKEYTLFDKDGVSVEAYRHKEITIGSEEDISDFIKSRDCYVIEKS